MQEHWNSNIIQSKILLLFWFPPAISRCKNQPEVEWYKTNQQSRWWHANISPHVLTHYRPAQICFFPYWPLLPRNVVKFNVSNLCKDGKASLASQGWQVLLSASWASSLKGLDCLEPRYCSSSWSPLEVSLSLLHLFCLVTLQAINFSSFEKVHTACTAVCCFQKLKQSPLHH